MGGRAVTPLRSWFDQASAGAPPALRSCAAEYLDAVPPTGDHARDLAVASTRALDATLRHAGGRDVALDLLAADALVTLALMAQAVHQPATLAGFAASLRTAGSAAR
jgi:hypothetical protein